MLVPVLWVCFSGVHEEDKIEREEERKKERMEWGIETVECYTEGIITGTQARPNKQRTSGASSPLKLNLPPPSSSPPPPPSLKKG